MARSHVRPSRWVGYYDRCPARTLEKGVLCLGVWSEECWAGKGTGNVPTVASAVPECLPLACLVVFTLGGMKNWNCGGLE